MAKRMVASTNVISNRPNDMRTKQRKQIKKEFECPSRSTTFSFGVWKAKMIAIYSGFGGTRKLVSRRLFCMYVCVRVCSRALALFLRHTGIRGGKKKKNSELAIKELYRATWLHNVRPHHAKRSTRIARAGKEGEGGVAQVPL